MKAPPTPAPTPSTPPMTLITTASIEELDDDVVARGADRAAHADLPRALAHRDQHHVGDADAADQQADGGDGGHQLGERRLRGGDGRGDRAGVDDLEVLLGAG